MRQNYFEHVDNVTNEINRTSLAESAAEEFNKSSEDGPLDDPDHWIWDCAHEIGCEYETERLSQKV